MIARMQLLALVFLVLSLAAWWAWALPQGLDLAWAGMGVFAGMYVLGLGLPFVLMHAVNQADVAPRATLAQVLRAAVAEARWALVVFGWRQPLRSTSVPDRPATQPPTRNTVSGGTAASSLPPPPQPASTVAPATAQITTIFFSIRRG